MSLKELGITFGSINQCICGKNSWDENLFMKMFITIVIVNLREFFGANYDSYKKSYQLKSNKKNFQREIHARICL